MFGETTISYVKIWNPPIETTIYKWLFGVPGGQTRVSISTPKGSGLEGKWDPGYWREI